MGGMIAGRTASEMPGLDIAEQRSWQHFLDAALRLYGTLNRELMDDHKLTLVDVRLLEILDHSSSGSARMGDLAEQLMALPSRVTRQIRRLETAGLVRRGTSPEDGRGVVATITQEGRRIVDEACARLILWRKHERGLRILGAAVREGEAAGPIQQIAHGDDALERIGAPFTQGERSWFVKREQAIVNERRRQEWSKGARGRAQRKARFRIADGIVFRQNNAVAHNDKRRAAVFGAVACRRRKALPRLRARKRR